MWQIIKYAWQHALVKNGYIGAFFAAILGLSVECHKVGFDKMWENYTSSALSGLYGVLIWISLLVIYHVIRAPLALENAALKAGGSQPDKAPCFTRAQKNRIISELNRFACQTPEISLSKEPGQGRYADALASILNAAGWSVRNEKGHAIGIDSGITIATHNSHLAMATALHNALVKEGFKVNPLSDSANWPTNYIMVTIGEIY